MCLIENSMDTESGSIAGLAFALHKDDLDNRLPLIAGSKWGPKNYRLPGKLFLNFSSLNEVV